LSTAPEAKWSAVETVAPFAVHGLEQNGKCLEVISTHNTFVERWAAKNANGLIVKKFQVYFTCCRDAHD
jgi:hypothetical protein